ncbi:hypothetical protein [Vibrio sp. 1180_3]|uniref:hypothetical protein n=1 Tax=Vibrio sp. 1180_3 TaxID=2528832 RepID=UPI002406C299|nr:hypothetical protein [Vibrio sp. 1180_3]MDF9399675.1 hypothetical protein [Vibrio sp. 1180_3]
MKINYLIYLFFSIGGAALSFFKLGYMASALQPESFGLYSLVMITFIYVGYIGSFGSNEYMLKIGSAAQNQMERVSIRNTALNYSISGVLLLSTIVFLISTIFIGVKVSDFVASLVILAIFSQPYNIFESYYRSSQYVISFSSMLFSKSLLSLIIAILFVESYGYWAAIFAEAIALLTISVVCFFVNSSSIVFFEFGNYRSKICLIFKEGFPFCLMTMLRNVSVSLERYIVSILFGLINLGLYSFLMISYQASVLGCGILMNVIGPKFIKMASNKKDSRKFLNSVIALFSVVTFLSVILYPSFKFLSPILVEKYFISYYSEQTFSILSYVYWLCLVSVLLFISDWILLSLSAEKIARNLTFLSLILVSILFPIGMYTQFGLSAFIEGILFIRLAVLFFTIIALYRAFEKKKGGW